MSFGSTAEKLLGHGHGHGHDYGHGYDHGLLRLSRDYGFCGALGSETQTLIF